MLKFNWRNGFAVGLTLGIFSTALVLLVGENLNDLAKCIAQTEHCESTQTQKDGKEPEWWNWTRRLVAAEDTLAQWIMAFFTIAATAVLLLTLRSANKTNAAAVKASQAALEANQIMRSEQRPWLWVRNFQIKSLTVWPAMGDAPPKIFAQWAYEIHNSGQFGATFENVDVCFAEFDDSYREAIPALETAMIARSKETPTRALAPNSVHHDEYSAVCEGLNIAVVIAYRGATDTEKVYITTQSFKVMRKSPHPLGQDNEPISLTAIEAGAVEVAIKPIGLSRMT